MRVSSLVALHALMLVTAFAAPAQAGGDPLQPAQWALTAVAAPEVSGLLGLDGGFFDAIGYALAHDVLVVAAAGNDALPLCSNQELLSAGVLCVGAVDRDGLRSGYSNFGLGVQVVAPGGAGGTPCGDLREDVLSTVAPAGFLLGRCQARPPLG